MPRLTPAYRIHHDLQYVGKMVKMAKRRVTWKFAFEGDDDEHSVVLQHTLNSGKKVIFLNGNQIYAEERVSPQLKFAALSRCRTSGLCLVVTATSL